MKASIPLFLLASFCLNILLPPPIALAQTDGVAYRYYETGEDITSTDALSRYAVRDSGVLPNFDISPAQREDYFGFVFTTYLEVTTAGEYTFYINSDDGSKLFVNDALIVDNEGRHSPAEKSGTVTLQPGRHALRLDYFEAYSIQVLEVRYAGPGISKQLIPNEVLHLDDDDTPTVSCGDVVLTTQAEVDAFNCTSVKSLTISQYNDSDPITNLEALGSLMTVDENFTIEGGGITDFTGLGSLTSVGSLIIADAGLESFQGLNSLQVVMGNLRLTTTYSITDFTGLENLKRIDGIIDLIDTRIASYRGLIGLVSVGGFDFSESFEVSDFFGLINLKTITGEIVLDGEESAINSFNGLNRVERIGTISMRSSYVPNFEGLGNLLNIESINVENSDLESFDRIGSANVENNVRVSNSSNFVDPSALANLKRIGGGLTLIDNPNLSDCCVLATTNLADRVEGNITLENNAPECSSLETVQANCKPIVNCGQDVVLRTQTEVDAFDCTSVQSLRIGYYIDENDPITNLNALASLVRIENDLTLYVTVHTDNGLASFEGLHNLKSIGGDLRLNTNLPNLQGLEGLETIEGNVFIEQGSLVSFEGLENLTTVGGRFSVDESFNLVNFEGLSQLDSIGGPLFIAYSGVENFIGLSALKSVGGIQYDNHYTEDFTGLSSLEIIRGSISVSNEAGIRTFRGLENVQEITGGISLGFNSVRSFEGLESLRQVGGSVTLQNLRVIENFAGLEQLQEVDGGIFISNTNIRSTEGLSSLQSVGGISVEGGSNSSSLATLDGIRQLRQVNGDLRITFSDIISVDPLGDIESITGDLILINNSNLSDCCILPEIIDKVQGEIILENNAPGCSSLAEVEESCGPSEGIYLEAECATITGTDSYWSVVNDGSASGNTLLQANTSYSGPNRKGRNDADRQIQFSVEVGQAGDYYLFARHTTVSGSGSSFIVRVNDGSWQTWTTNQTGPLAWQPVLGTTFALNAGTNTITVVNYRSGSQLDKLALSLDSTLPQGTEGTDPTCGRSARTAQNEKTLGKDSFLAEADWQITTFPNPAQDRLRVEVGEQSGGLQLTDLSGRVVRSAKEFSALSTGRYEADVRDLPAGLYLLQWKGKQSKTTKLFIER